MDYSGCDGVLYGELNVKSDDIVCLVAMRSRTNTPKTRPASSDTKENKAKEMKKIWAHDSSLTWTTQNSQTVVMTVACVESQNVSLLHVTWRPEKHFSLSGFIISEAGEALELFSVELSECSLMNSEVFLKSFMCVCLYLWRPEKTFQRSVCTIKANENLK